MRQAITTFILILAVTSASRAQTEVSLGYGKAELWLERETSLVAFGYRHEFNETQLRNLLGSSFGDIREHLVDRKTVVVEVNPAQLDSALASLRRQRQLRFAHPLHSLGSSLERQNWYILTEEVVVRFKQNLNVNQIQVHLDRARLQLVKPLRWLPGAYVLRVHRQDDPFLALERLAESQLVDWSHPNWLRHLGTRETIPNDPLFPNLWHLKNTGQGGGVVGADAKAGAAWDHVQGQGMTIAVIDTGVAPHNDLVLAATGYDILTGASPGGGVDLAGHGTSVAGVAAAKGNNAMLVCGMAHQATILPIRLLVGSGFGTATDEAGCFIWATDNGADVITNSWGPDGIPFPLPALVEAAFSYATTMGRGGLGVPIFWAAGNGNELIGTDEYVSSAYTIAVGAVTNLDLRANYSDYGPELDFVAPSSGGTRNINTTTLSNGTTLNFGGTSASAPLAAGVGALVLQAAPQLSWAQVGDILRNSATAIQSTIASYDGNGHSIYYGHGRLNAHQAVLDALATLPQSLSLTVATTGVGDITVDLKNMGPFHEWAIGFSGQVYTPVGSGPLFGVGWDALTTFLMPPGTIPFHHWANVHGSFHWGAIGVPAGITLQAVAIEVLADYSWRFSNVTSTTF